MALKDSHGGSSDKVWDVDYVDDEDYPFATFQFRYCSKGTPMGLCKRVDEC